jgi:hypothetical protein
MLNGAQDLGRSRLVACRLEPGEGLGEEIQRRAMVEQQLRAASLLIQRLGVRNVVGQVRRDRGGFQRMVEGAPRVDMANAVGRRQQQRQALVGLPRRGELPQDVVDRRHVGLRVTHARPRPGNRRRSPRGPDR